LLIMMQCPEATFVRGKQQWTKLGRWVREEEIDNKIAILAPEYYWRKVVERGVEREVKTLAYFKTVFVYDVAQTDGKPLPESKLEHGADASALYDALKEAVERETGFPVRVEPLPMGIYGGVFWLEHVVKLSERHDQSSHAQTLVHEWAHIALGHDDRDRSRDDCELEAESVAFVVLTTFGAPPGNFTSAYLTAHCGDEDFADKMLEIGERVLKCSKQLIEQLAARLEGVPNGREAVAV
jgi:hypothetical protein